jgi:hypothetical protein
VSYRIFFIVPILGVLLVNERSAHAEELPTGPRAEAWKRVEDALNEGKPKTAAEALAGVEQAAVADKAWDEVARAIATRVLTETGDRPPEDPERLVRLAAAIETAPPETRPVLEAIRANWTWGYFQLNRWRFQQRTAGGAEASELARIGEWDLPTIVSEIRKRFAAAVDGGGALQKLPVGEWKALLTKGTMPDAYRPAVWDVVIHDAIAPTPKTPSNSRRRARRSGAQTSSGHGCRATTRASPTPTRRSSRRPRSTARCSTSMRPMPTAPPSSRPTSIGSFGPLAPPSMQAT